MQTLMFVAFTDDEVDRKVAQIDLRLQEHDRRLSISANAAEQIQAAAHALQSTISAAVGGHGTSGRSEKKCVRQPGIQSDLALAQPLLASLRRRGAAPSHTLPPLHSVRTAPRSTRFLRPDLHRGASAEPAIDVPHRPLRQSPFVYRPIPSEVVPLHLARSASLPPGEAHCAIVLAPVRKTIVVDQVRPRVISASSPKPAARYVTC